MNYSFFQIFFQIATKYAFGSLCGREVVGDVGSLRDKILGSLQRWSEEHHGSLAHTALALPPSHQNSFVIIPKVYDGMRGALSLV